MIDCASLGQALRQPLVLASASPRRAQLLRQVGWAFEVVVSDVEEPQPAPGVDPRAFALRCARDKALQVARRCPHRLVLGADTEVILQGRPLGKPTTSEHARAMLRALSGRRHEVITAVALALGDGRDARLLAQDAVITAVTFRPLSAAEIADYVATGEPMDKAGAYGIQERGALLVAGIEGCYFSVVGLPLARLGEMLAALGYPGGPASPPCALKETSALHRDA